MLDSGARSVSGWTSRILEALIPNISADSDSSLCSGIYFVKYHPGPGEMVVWKKNKEDREEGKKRQKDGKRPTKKMIFPKGRGRRVIIFHTYIYPCFYNC